MTPANCSSCLHSANNPKPYLPQMTTHQHKLPTTATTQRHHVTSNRIAASAGTGKTYQLASRYITLLLLGAKPEEIIALTFTRKAAGEFRNRILHALAEGADDKRHAKTHRNELAVRVWEVLSGLSVVPTEYGSWDVVPASNPVPLLPVTEALVRLAAEQRQYPEELYNEDRTLQAYYQIKPATAATFADLLKNMVAVLSKLQLSTLDSFFASLVSANSLDLGLNNVSTLDPAEEDTTRTEDILRYLDTQNADEATRTDFLEMFRRITEGLGNTTQSRINDNIKNFLQLYRDLPQTQWGNIDSFPSSPNFRLATDEELDHYNNAAAELKKLLQLHGSELLSEKALSQFRELANGGFRLKRDAASAICNVPRPNDNADTAQQPISRIALLADTLQNTVIPCKLRIAAERSASLQKLIAGYQVVYDTRMKAQGRLTFADIARMAQKLMLRDDADEHRLRHHIAYRMGSKLSHWMLDEFQDTSESQFNTLTPLLQPIAEEAGSNALDFSEERWASAMPPELQGKLTPGRAHPVAKESLFIVGDTKQSIYGFRTGKTEVFERLATQEPWKTPLQPSPLQRSFRSAPVLMEFTNELFSALAKVEQPEQQAPGCITTNPVIFSADFTEHSSAKELPGYVEISFIPPPDKNTDADDANLKTLIFDKVVQILQELTVNGKSPKNGMSIAILVRSNSDADAVQNHIRNLMPKLPTILVKDSLAAVACPLGEILLYFFKWLLHPGDTAALNVVKTSFLAPHIGRESNQSHAEWLQTLQDIGYLGVLRRLLTTIPEEDAQENRAIIRCWENAALAFDTNGGTPAAWVLHIQNLCVQATGATGAVQIMTMHKSKGLEFDAVILPYPATKAVDAESELKYFISEDNKSLILPPGGKDTWPHFGNSFTTPAARWQQQQRKEAYNLLYVAVTRAKHANYIICHGARLLEIKQSQKTGKTTYIWKASARSVSGLLRQACVLMQPHAALTLDKMPHEQTLILKGEANWYNKLNKKSAPPQAPPPMPVPGAAIPRRLRISPSQLAAAEDKQQQEPADSPTPPRYNSPGSGADFGSKVHKTWEQILWTEATEKLPFSTPQNDEQTVVHHALQQADVAALFTRRPGQEVYNEQSVEAITDQDEWVSATIDRLILTYNAAGQVVAAHIIDFKTNHPCPRDGYGSFRDWLLAHYAHQMRSYRQLICSAFSLQNDAVTVSLISCPKDYRHHPACVLTYPNDMLAPQA